MQQRNSGVTLIELLIVATVIGILAALAYPAYQEQVRDARRAEAQGALLSLANAMERYYVQNNQFSGATVGASGIFPAEVPLDGERKYYDLAIPSASLTATAYTLQARPKNGQAGDGCLELLSIGTRIHYRDDDCSGTATGW